MAVKEEARFAGEVIVLPWFCHKEAPWTEGGWRWGGEGGDGADVYAFG